MSEKSCGNCGNVYATQLLCRHAEEDWEHGSASYYAGVTSPNAKPCDHWVKGDDTLEQRYEQLELVTREMLTYLANIKADFTMLKLTQDTQRFREQIIDCGVNLDD